MSDEDSVLLRLIIVDSNAASSIRSMLLLYENAMPSQKLTDDEMAHVFV